MSMKYGFINRIPGSVYTKTKQLRNLVKSVLKKKKKVKWVVWYWIGQTIICLLFLSHTQATELIETVMGFIVHFLEFL